MFAKVLKFKIRVNIGILITNIPNDYWFSIVESLYKERGEIPDRIDIRAEKILKAFGIPQFLHSAIEIQPKTKNRINKEKDKVIAEYLTNKQGVLISENVISCDFRDIYPDGLPEELRSVLDQRTRAIMEIEYRHLKEVSEFAKILEDIDISWIYYHDYPVVYFRLHGGVDVFIRGYWHVMRWQDIHGKYLKEVNKHASIIAIEGNASIPFGESLTLRWKAYQRDAYGSLMRESVEIGFKGLFTQVDMRNISKVQMDFSLTLPPLKFPDLPYEFFKEYFEYLERENPSLAKKAGSPKRLNEILKAQSFTQEGIFTRDNLISKEGKTYFAHPYVTKDLTTSFKPTYMELGQKLFADSLIAIKLYLIAKLMNDGYLEKGPIVVYMGPAHVPTIEFFLRCPQYAMVVVLRTINELMAGRVKKEGNISEIYEVFRKPNWPEIIKEIARLVFKKPNKSKWELLDYPINFLETYNINPYILMPPDEKIDEMIEKYKNNYK